MKNRLLIVRNQTSPLLSAIQLERPGQDVVLINESDRSSLFCNKGAKLLDNPNISAEIADKCDVLNYDALLDAILVADQVIVI